MGVIRAGLVRDHPRELLLQLQLLRLDLLPQPIDLCLRNHSFQCVLPVLWQRQRKQQ